MRVVVFGGSGFLGSHVADILSEKRYDVVIYDINPSRYIRKNQEMVIGDVLDKESVANVLKGVDYAYNFSGIADIDEAASKPLETLRQNVLGGAIVAEGCRSNKVKRLIFASSVYVYSDSGSFYSTSKRACESILENYRKSYGINFTVLRYGSLYGPRSNETNWIYRMLKQALAEKKITRNGNGGEIREYIHVHDAALLSVKALSEEYKNQYIVISGNQPIKMRDLLRMVKEMLGSDIEIEYADADNEEHYDITPYSFNPNIAKRIIADSYLDMGQGLLDMMHKIHNKKDTVKV